MPIGLGLAAAAWAWWTWERAIDVEAWLVAPSRFTIEAMAPATLDALTKTSISAPLQARITSIAREIGERVDAGDVLVRLDDAALLSALDNATAVEAASLRGIELAKAESVRAQAALTNARAQFERVVQLRDKGWATKADFDAKLLALDAAEAEAARARTYIVQAEAQADASAASRRTQQSRLDDATIRAPIAGVVIARLANSGDVVAPSQPILELASPSSLVVSGRFDESSLGHLAQGQRARVVFHSEPGRIYGATVERIGRKVDQETREVTTDIKLDAPPTSWAVGQRAEVHVALIEREHAMAVPAKTLVWRERIPHIWLLSDGRARLQAVAIGQTGGDRVEILSGLVGATCVLSPTRLYARRRVNARGCS